MDNSQPKSSIDSLQSFDMQSISALKILIVDDAESDRVTYARYLQSDSEKTYHLIEATTLQEGLELWRSQQPDIVLIDLNLPDGDGLEFLEAINVVGTGDRVPVVMLTGQGNEKMAVSAMKLGAADYLVKGDITAKLLTNTVRHVLRESVLSRQLLRSQLQETVVAEIGLRIREFVGLDDISNAIVKEVRQFINADRAAIYQFNPEDMSGKIVAEDIVSPWQPCLNVQVQDTCFRENLGGAYCEGRIFVANDIYAANLTACHIKLLERFQVRANLVVPILLPNADKRILWGLLILHQCSAPRIWEESDVQLLQRLSVKLSISIKQAIAYQLLQTELTERKRVEALLLDHQVELEERNNLLEETSADLECTVEELRVTTEDLITQHRQLEYEQIRYQNLFNFAPDGYLVTDIFGRISEANQAILNLLASSYTAILRKFFATFIDSDHLELFYRQLNSLASQNKLEATWELTINPCWGNPFPAEIIATKNIDTESDNVQLLWVIRNISDRKRTEQELQQLNQSLEAKVTERSQELDQVNKLQRAILDGTDYAIISSDLNGIIQTFNAGAEKMLGYSKEEVIGKVTPEIFHDSQQVLDRITKASTILGKDLGLGFGALLSMAMEGLIDEEWINIRKDGSRFPISISVTVLKDDNDQPIGALSIRRDISDRKLAEESLRESEQRFENLAAAAPVAIFQINQNNECTYVNEFWSQITGQDSSVALGYGWLQTIHPDDREQIHQQWTQASNQRAFYQGEGRCIKPDGTIRCYYCQAIPELDEDGIFKGYIGTLTDISDRKQAELQLHQTTDRLALALNSGAIGCWEWNIQQNLLVWDDRMYELYGALKETSSHIPYEIWINAIHPDDRDATETLLQQTVLEKAEYDCEFRVIYPDRSIHFIKAYGKVKRDTQGNAESMIGVNFDISASKFAEQALKQQIAAIEAAIDGIAILQNNRYIYLNKSHLEIFGYEHPDELLGKSWTELYSSEELARFEREVFPLLQRDRSWQGEAIAIHKNGSTFDEGLSLTITEDGLLICVCRNISDRKRAEIALQRSEDRFRRVFDSSVVGMLFADFQGKVIDANDRFLEMVGYTREDFQAGLIDWVAMTPPEYLEKDYACMKSLRAHTQIPPWEKEYYRKDGSRLSIIIGAALLQGTNNETICVILDISDRKQTEIHLKLANQELLRATKLKDEFLANMSHELRTPLNSILGLSESLCEEILGSLNEKQLRAVSTIESSGEHLLSLINDILDLSKMSSGMMSLDVETVSVRNLCDSSLTFVKQQAFQKKLQLNSSIPPIINNIKIDERRIKQALINLLTNAVKFTPNEGSINLFVAFGSGDTWQGEAKIPQRIKIINSPMILFQVVDTGIGIATNDLRLLFQPFVQVDSALNRQYEGTGLGLALVKQIVELHGGQVMVESEVGQGSCFTVALPYEMSPSNAIDSVPTSTPSSALDINPDNAPLILLAEDNEANIQTFSSYLTAVNYRVILARNGVEAIAQAKENLPDIILMDVQMPTMDGLEATRQIRLDPNLISTPIIALTALAMEDDRERCLAAGMNGYISKPLKLKQLARQIAELLAAK